MEISRIKNQCGYNEFGTLLFNKLFSFLSFSLINLSYHELKTLNNIDVDDNKSFYLVNDLENYYLKTYFKGETLQIAAHEALQVMDAYEKVMKEKLALPVGLFKKIDGSIALGYLSSNGINEIATSFVNDSYEVHTSFSFKALKALIDYYPNYLPPYISPCNLAIVRIDYTKEGVSKYAKEVYKLLKEHQYNVLFENLEDNHITLIDKYVKIGYTIIIGVGKKDVAESMVNVFLKNNIHQRIKLSELFDFIATYIENEQKRLINESIKETITMLSNAKHISLCSKCLKDYKPEKGMELYLPFMEKKESCCVCNSEGKEFIYLKKE